MSFKTDRKRFATPRHRGMGIKYARHKARNYWSGLASIAMSQGDMAEYHKCMANYEAASTMSAASIGGLGPAVVAIADRRPNPPESAE